MMVGDPLGFLADGLGTVVRVTGTPVAQAA
jgi:hypothetical protein